LVDRRVLTREAAHDDAAPVVDADRGAVAVVLADALRRDEVERTRPEAVRRARQRADRADLDRVAREVGRERTARGVEGRLADRARRVLRGQAHRLVDRGAVGLHAAVHLDRLGAVEVQDVGVERADLLAVGAVHLAARAAAATTLQVDERVAGDLLLEARAALAQEAPGAVEQDPGRGRDRRGERAVGRDGPTTPRSVSPRLP